MCDLSFTPLLYLLRGVPLVLLLRKSSAKNSFFESLESFVRIMCPVQGLISGCTRGSVPASMFRFHIIQQTCEDDCLVHLKFCLRFMLCWLRFRPCSQTSKGSAPHAHSGADSFVKRATIRDNTAKILEAFHCIELCNFNRNRRWRGSYRGRLV